MKIVKNKKYRLNSNIKDIQKGIIEVRGIIDENQIVFRYWSKEARGHKYKIRSRQWFELLETNLQLSEY